MGALPGQRRDDCRAAARRANAQLGAAFAALSGPYRARRARSAASLSHGPDGGRHGAGLPLSLAAKSLRWLNSVESRIDGFLPFLRDELALHPGRLHSAVRMAVIAAVGAGLMAAMHVDSELGLYLIWSMVSAPAAMMRPRNGAILILATGIGLAVSVPLAGVLVEAPWMLIAFFAFASALSTYLLTDAQLSNGWRMVQIFFLTSFWIVVFDPASLGWSAGYAFAAGVVGFSLIILFDNVLWPDPADRKLLRLLAGSAQRTRKRLIEIGRGYLDPPGSASLPRTAIVGTMSAQLALLSRA